MKHASHVRFVMAFLALATLIPLRTSAATPSVVLAEINWGGSSLSQADEWIELANISDELVSLNGWTLDGAATSNGSITLPELSIAPHSSLLLSNYTETSTSSTLASIPSYMTTSISLSNSALSLVLRDASGTLVDSAGDSTSPPAGQSAEPHSSMQRIDPSIDGSLDAAWIAATDRLGFDDEFEQYGSPGISPWWIVPSPAPIVLEETVAPVEVTDTEEPVVVSEPITTEVVEPVDEQGTTDDGLVVTEEPAIEQMVIGDGLVVTEEIAVESEPLVVVSNPEPETSHLTPETSEALVTDDPPVAQIQEQIISPEEFVAEAPSSETAIENQTLGTPTTDESVATNMGTEVSIRLSALFPSPANGESEWVEITNTSNEVVALVGWTLREGSGKITTIPDGDLAANASLVVRSIKGNLNNGGDTVDLISPDGLVQDSITYDGDLVPDSGETLERSDSGWTVISTIVEESVDVSETADAINTTLVEAEQTVTEAAPETTAVSEPIITNIVPADFSSLRLNGLYPNTNESDADEEFIEIKNTGTTSISLNGLTLVDASGNEFDLSGQTVAASSVLSLSRQTTGIVLNNDLETITLKQTDGTTIDSVSYEKAPKGSTLDFANNAWTWSPLSPSVESSVVSTNEERATSTPRTGTSTSPAVRTNRSRVAATLTLTAEQIRAAADETRVRFSGEVAIVPGTSGKQVFYATDETGTIQIYKNDAKFPELQVGDRIALTGTLSTAQGEKRIKIMKDDTITVTGHTGSVEPVTQTIETLTDKNVGDLIDVSGTVREVDKDKVTLEDGENTIVVKLPSGSSAVSSALVPGAKVSVTGLLTKSEDGYRLLARSTDDIRVASPAAALTEPTGQERQAANDSTIARILGLTVLLILLVSAAREFYPRIKYWYAKRSLVRHASQALR